MQSSASNTKPKPSLSASESPVLPPASLNSSTSTTHPFANSTAKLELIQTPTSADGIDIEAEARLYDELCRSYEAETEDFAQSNVSTPTGAPHQKPSKAKPKHTRPLSLLPAESIFSADIFLADNTSPSASSSSPLFAQDVTISGWTTVGDRARKTGAYVAYDCAIVTREGTTMHILKRYTAFEELYGRLKRTLPHSLLPFLPSLPPKAPLARFRPTFLDSRRKLLQFWLASVLLHPEIGGREVVRDWVLS